MDKVYKQIKHVIDMLHSHLKIPFDHCGISGSSVLWLYMFQEGLEPHWVPNDIDVYIF
jgi:hypothetical protein